PLSYEELAKLERLVEQAIGFDPQRGDTISVINSAFTESDTYSTPVWENPVYIDLAMKVGRYLLLILAAWLVWRKVLRPIITAQTQQMSVPAGPSTELQEEIDRAAEAKRRASELNRYEDNLQAARTLADQDPRAVAMLVRSLMEKDGYR